MTTSDKLKDLIESHLSLSISGPSSFPHSTNETDNYTLTVTLKYHAPSPAPHSLDPPPPLLPAITIKEAFSPLSTLSSLLGLYRLYPVQSSTTPSNPSNPSINPETGVKHEASAEVPVHFSKADIDLDITPKPVTEDNGFTCLHPGEEVVRDVAMVPMCHRVEQGERYVIRIVDASGEGVEVGEGGGDGDGLVEAAVEGSGEKARKGEWEGQGKAYGRIEWWGVGELSAFEGEKVAVTERSKDGGLIVRDLGEGVEVVVESAEEEKA
ncbi:uncharacterized protein KY384_002314 [Bacidia gigantensis]|uniref:uncharacterized protein n=1 Tax=Bacidia gigantensis TaxID=2732470 RepID=UPI001D050CC6|nr:uncharacterized protein KY384_002314 [Bacidia gigantensis]KAG8532437.1 hypothetical protein KY384_002314 [Bacidia gigantensis]